MTLERACINSIRFYSLPVRDCPPSSADIDLVYLGESIARVSACGKSLDANYQQRASAKPRPYWEAQTGAIVLREETGFTANAKRPVKSRSPSSVLRKNQSVGGNSGCPTVRAWHHPAKVFA